MDLGAAYARTLRPEEALEQYGLALALEPNLATLHSNKATALMMLGRWEEAEQAARRAVQLDPKSIDANYMLGIAMMAQGKITPETAAYLAIAAKKHPNWEEAHVEVLSLKTGQRKTVVHGGFYGRYLPSGHPHRLLQTRPWKRWRVQNTCEDAVEQPHARWASPLPPRLTTRNSPGVKH